MKTVIDTSDKAVQNIIELANEGMGEMVFIDNDNELSEFWDEDSLKSLDKKVSELHLDGYIEVYSPPLDSDNGLKILCYTGLYNRLVDMKLIDGGHVEMDEETNTLEDVMRLIGCNKPFLKNPKENVIDGETEYEYFTSNGAKTYDNLVEIIYTLGNMGVIDDSQDVVERMDEIVKGVEY